ncbi:hypothetical protein [Streptomyces sp. NPDC046727]|uniref:hypothetical protein n=1 Tax=Streptomyces sp. NPDC046727 TaxID=3155373 RepID=UPI0033CB92B2
METEQRSFRRGHEALHLEFALGDDGNARLTHLGLPGEAGKGPRGSLPLMAVTATGHGCDWSGSRLVRTAIGGRLRHRTHRAARDGDWHNLTVRRLRLQLQSTSDQQNLHHSAPIAASAPTAVTPEQGAVWAYPQPDDSLDEVALTMAGALLGRIHLSGRPPKPGPEARALVHEAVAVYKAVRGDLSGPCRPGHSGCPAGTAPGSLSPCAPPPPRTSLSGAARAARRPPPSCCLSRRAAQPASRCCTPRRIRSFPSGTPTPPASP